MNGGAVTIVYDAFGNRVSKTVGGVTTKYLVEDDVNPTGYPQVLEEIVSGAVQRQYTYGLQRISQTQQISGAWTPSFYEFDGGGHVRQLTNASGAVTDSYEYDAWGNTLSTSGSTPNEFLYRGEQLDSDLGLYYLRARWYNPATGRFLSQDPWPGAINKPSSLHRYRYAAGNPVNRIDPFGTDDTVEVGATEGELALASEEGEAEVAKEESCILYEAASELAAVAPVPELELISDSVKLEGSECGAEAASEGEGPLETCARCFAAGTPIHTDHGDVPIEQIAVGDQVVARNRATGKLETQPVTALTTPHHDKLLEVRVEGERNPLHPSTGHPFWAKRGDAEAEWTPAGEMRVGDRLITIGAEWRMITGTTPLPGEQTVYNFTVAKDHDYFVGETGFLVHNAGNCDCIPEIERHLDRLGALDHPPNERMLQRLEDGFDSPWDRNFAEHELIESGLMDNGLSPPDAHLGTLELQGIPYEPGFQRYLYDPDVIEEFPQWFNPACRNPI